MDTHTSTNQMNLIHSPPLNGQQAALLNAEWECKEIVTPTCVNLIYHEIEYTKSTTCQNCN